MNSRIVSYSRSNRYSWCAIAEILVLFCHDATLHHPVPVPFNSLLRLMTMKQKDAS